MTLPGRIRAYGSDAAEADSKNGSPWNTMPGAWPYIDEGVTLDHHLEHRRKGFTPVDISRPGPSVVHVHSPTTSFHPINSPSSPLLDSLHHSPEPAFTSAHASPAIAIPSAKASAIRSSVSGSSGEHEQSVYYNLLKRRNLRPPVHEELNWSGRKPGHGQHVEFKPSEEIPLEEQGLLGNSITASVDRVKCRRIQLARKSMTCNRRLPLEQALNEVEHLHSLRHPHIIQLCGSYVQGRTFAILFYPVAHYDLKKFMKMTEDALRSKELTYAKFLPLISLGSFFGCLASAVDFIHMNCTKHMDIKPQNILVRINPKWLPSETETQRLEKGPPHHVYLADFGVSRSFCNSEHSQTESVTAMTRKYCAPEVFKYEKWGRSADIFSLGAVFLEMLTVLTKQTLDDFSEYRQGASADDSFHANIPRTLDWADKLDESFAFMPYGPVFERANLKKAWLRNLEPSPESCLDVSERRFQLTSRGRLIPMIKQMLAENPSLRPSASGILGTLWAYPLECCGKRKDRFEAISDSDLSEALSSMEWPSERSERLFPWIDKPSNNLHCLILEAVFFGHNPLIDQLLKMSNLDMQSSEFPSILGAAVATNNISLMRRLLRDGAKIQDALSEAVSTRSTRTLKLLLNSGAVIDRRYWSLSDQFVDDSKIALRRAISQENADIIRLLGEKGISENDGGENISLSRASSSSPSTDTNIYFSAW